MEQDDLKKWGVACRNGADELAIALPPSCQDRLDWVACDPTTRRLDVKFSGIDVVYDFEYLGTNYDKACRIADHILVAHFLTAADIFLPEGEPWCEYEVPFVSGMLFAFRKEEAHVCR